MKNCSSMKMMILNNSFKTYKKASSVRFADEAFSVNAGFYHFTNVPIIIRPDLVFR